MKSDSSLLARLAQDLTEIGPQPFAWFMRRALYDPHDGFYGAGKARVGREGDFVTSVSSSPVFAQLLGLQFEEMWERLGRPAPFHVIEQGAHTGQFLEDLLCWLPGRAPAFARAVAPVIIEPSPVWRKRQEKVLRAWQGKIRWYDSLETVERATGVHFSNELADAFPVHLVRWDGGSWRELYVVWDGERLHYQAGPPSSPQLGAALGTLPRSLPPGYTTEVNLEARRWMRECAKLLDRGYLLTADYGRLRASYYEPGRRQGTLRAFRDHRRVVDAGEFLQCPGECDLTADVEFTSLAEAGIEAGLQLEGFADQHHFLVGVGRPEFARLEATAADPQTRVFLRGYQALTHPGAFGGSFHFLCLKKNAADAAPLSGFQFAPDPAKALAG